MFIIKNWVRSYTFRPSEKPSEKVEAIGLKFIIKNSCNSTTLVLINVIRLKTAYRYLFVFPMMKKYSQK